MNFKKILNNISKNSVAVLAAFAVLLTLSVAMLKGCSTNNYQNYTSKVIGKMAVPDLNTNNVAKIIIVTAGKKRIMLNKVEDTWKVVNLYNYNADSKKINSFLDSLKTAKIIQTLTDDAASEKRLYLNLMKYKAPKNSGAVSVKLLNSNDKLIADVSIGKKRTEEIRESSEKLLLGRYLKTGNYSQILFTDTQFISTGFDKYHWLDHEFPKIKEIKSVKLAQNNKIIWEIERSSLSDKFFLNGNEKNKIDNNNIMSITSILNNFDFSSIANPSTGIVVAGLDKPKTLIVETFNAQRFVIQIGNKEDNSYYVKIEAVGQPSNEIYKNWIYLIDSKRIEELIISKEQLMKNSVPSNDGSFNLPIS